MSMVEGCMEKFTMRLLDVSNETSYIAMKRTNKQILSHAISVAKFIAFALRNAYFWG
jgi:hypothetical protein